MGPASSKMGPASSKSGSKAGPASAKIKTSDSADKILPDLSDSSDDESKRKKPDAVRAEDFKKPSDDKKPSEDVKTAVDKKHEDVATAQKNDDVSKNGTDAAKEPQAETKKNFIDAFNDALDGSTSSAEDKKNEEETGVSGGGSGSLDDKQVGSKLFSSDSETEIAAVKDKAVKSFDELFGSDLNGKEDKMQL